MNWSCLPKIHPSPSNSEIWEVMKNTVNWCGTNTRPKGMMRRFLSVQVDMSPPTSRSTDMGFLRNPWWVKELNQHPALMHFGLVRGWHDILLWQRYTKERDELVFQPQPGLFAQMAREKWGQMMSMSSNQEVLYSTPTFKRRQWKRELLGINL